MLAKTMHCAVQVPVLTNATCSSNKTCVFELVEDAFFNLEDSVITRARHTYVTTQPDLLKVPPSPPPLATAPPELPL